MPAIKIHGGSDDLVEIEGQIDGCDEYGFYQVGKTGYLSASDGSVVSVGYAIDDTGCWRVALVHAGTAAFTHVRNGDEEAENQDGVSGYSDLATLEGDDLTWVKWHGKSKSKALAQSRATAKLRDPAIRAAFDLLFEAGVTTDQYSAALTSSSSMPTEGGEA